MRAIGVHLLQSFDLVDTPRRSVVVEVEPLGAVTRIVPVTDIAEIVQAIGPEPAQVVVDAPLAVPNETGQRDVERILAWCDVPAFPVARGRLAKVHGGLRGIELREALPNAVVAHETHLDLTLRLLMWEETEGGSLRELDDYRTRWLGLRAPRYRPKGPGRATTAGLVAVAALLSRHIDTGGWIPTSGADDWGPIHDAAVVDAMACAYVAHRAVHRPDEVLVIGSAARGQMLLPTDENLRARLLATVARLAADGAIAP